jgi:hypothetical protein
MSLGSRTDARGEVEGYCRFRSGVVEGSLLTVVWTMSYFTENASPVDSGAYAYKEKYNA